MPFLGLNEDKSEADAQLGVISIYEMTPIRVIFYFIKRNDANL